MDSWGRRGGIIRVSSSMDGNQRGHPTFREKEIRKSKGEIKGEIQHFVKCWMPLFPAAFSSGRE
jgi:hypothetical protein